MGTCALRGSSPVALAASRPPPSQLTSPLPSPSPGPSEDRGTLGASVDPEDAIIGGSVAGVALLCALLTLACFKFRRSGAEDFCTSPLPATFLASLQKRRNGDKRKDSDVMTPHYVIGTPEPAAASLEELELQVQIREAYFQASPEAYDDMPPLPSYKVQAQMDEEALDTERQEFFRNLKSSGVRVLDGGQSETKRADIGSDDLCALVEKLEVYGDKYTIVKESGVKKSNSGVVCSAWDQKSRAKVVLKFFSSRQDFETEAANCKACSCSHIVKVLDTIQAVQSTPAPRGRVALQKQAPESIEQLSCLVMERGDRTLAEHMKQDALDHSEKKAIMADIFTALAFMHKKGIVHGDVKPANVVRIGDVWKVIDLANAQRVDRSPSSMHYTLRYAAPEVVNLAMQGKRDIPRDPACDVWSTGVIMYELFSGMQLFDNSMTDQDVVLELLSTHSAIHLEGLRNMEPHAARIIKDKLLVRDPVDRSIAEVILGSSLFGNYAPQEAPEEGEEVNPVRSSASPVGIAAILRNI
ncbi:hypothetical protein CYMTET_42920 [Cymbomonas tetramitiformis]|uniref:Protein kinase domain-containing protein n=1 Tax=Cymbomonas tetramitiformis TaxID=36881 RepID=A0AAE0EWM8_9CHLO|nr:hypothetical protein CYMTET_46912 [Cymbomonas tetramitiformis]KAK3247584.1 hypothetical protein CYMTET_42920 [Cymbomonas tetramitiformis]